MTISRVDLLVHYAQKPVNQFYQLDGFYMEGGGDDIMHADSDGDCVMSHVTDELMSTCPEVRVLIPLGTPREHVARLLSKLADWAQKNADQFEPKRVRTAADGAEHDLRRAMIELENQRRLRMRGEDDIEF